MTAGATRPRRSAAGWLAALLLVVPAACWAKEENGSMQGVQFTLTPRAERWVAGAQVVLDMKVENRGQAEIAFPNPMLPTSPQPTYTLARPDGESATFTPADGAEPGAPTIVRLPPQSAWTGELVLDDLRLAGRYTLTAVIDWDPVRLESPPAAFEVEAARFETLAVALSRAADGGGTAEALVLQRADGAARTVAALLEEEDPTVGEMPVENVRDRGEVPADATAVLAPYANYETSRDPLEWVVCRTPGGVWIGTGPGAPAVERKAKGGLVEVATPLAAADHHLYLVGLLAAGKDGASPLGFAKVAAPKGKADKGAFAAVQDFPARPVAIAAALGTEAQGSPIVAGAVLPAGSDADAGTRLVVLGLGHDGAVGWTREVDVAGLAAVPPLALHVDAEGRVHAAFLARGAGGVLQLATVSAMPDADAAAWAPAVREVAPAADSGAAAIAFAEFAPGRVSRAVLVRRGEDPPLVILDGAAPRAALIPVPADAQVALVRGLSAWYAVVATRERITADPV